MATLTIETVCQSIESHWGMRPLLTLACAGGSDQHWQIFHPARLDMPCFTFMDHTLEEHPDAPDLGFPLTAGDEH